MTVRVVHRLGAANITSDGMTTCGIVACRKVAEGEYLALDKSTPIKVVRLTWEGVTCKSCLRNPHAPGNRYYRLEDANVGTAAHEDGE